MSDNILFSPMTIKSMTVRNRIVLPSMVTLHAAINGEVTDKLIQYHEERAKGGCGLNILEATYVSRDGNSYLRGVGASDDFMIPGLTRLVEAVHAQDGKIGIQLQHGGRTANPQTSGHPIKLVSQVPGLTPYEDSRVMDRQEISAIVLAYAHAAERALKAGFDCIELHGAHGYLIAQFMSPYTNKRTDEYGGSFENRMRFPLEVLRAVRDVVGPDYPLLFRMSMDEFVPDGIDLDMAKQIAITMTDHGIDALHLSVGVCETNQYTIPPSCIEQGWNGKRAAAVKEAIENRIPVIVAGRITDRKTAEAILNSGQANMVAMGRAQIADPFIAVKMASGLDAEILPCVACNEGCVGAGNRNETLSCAVNPRTGNEGRYPLLTAPHSRTVIVVGGGPAGMQAALTAAQRGHTVTLIEKESRLGGLLHIAKLPPHKEAYGKLVTYFEHVLPKAGVRLKLGTTATPDLLRELKAESIILATGSVPLLPRFLQEAPVITAQETLLGKSTGQRVLILGGGLVGCETAEFLAEQGKEVSILELRGELAADMEVRTRKLLLPRLKMLGVQALLNHEVTAISPKGVVSARDAFRTEHTLADFDTLVLSMGYRSERTLEQNLVEQGIPYIAIGDCAKPGKVLTAMRQAMQVAYSL